MQNDGKDAKKTVGKAGALRGFPSLKLVMLLLLSLYFLLGFSAQSYAWNFEGHTQLTLKIYDGLTAHEQDYFYNLASLLGKKNTRVQVGRLGSWADRHRDKTLKSLFRSYGQSVPGPLKPDENLNTSLWHFHNTFVSSANREIDFEHCRLENRGGLLEKILLLDDVLFNSELKLSKKQEAIVIAIQLHLLQDLHQPLHLLSGVGGRCRHDLGGNKVCLDHGKAKRCALNLHQYWDGGLGLFEKKTTAVTGTSSWSFEYKLAVEERSDVNLNNDKQKNITSSLRLDEWTANTASFVNAVYDKDNSPLSAVYQARGRKVVEKQLARCVLRSTQYLKSYYLFVHSNKN